MISLILPYWNRQEAADRALELIAQHYAHMLDLEVIIVDDGSPVPFRMPDLAVRARVVRLPLKDEPKSPATCWNEGVKAAKGDIIALSCIEVLHTKPVLDQMRSELLNAGRDGYVLAAAWCPEQQAWHTHSSVEVPECPKGAGLAFLGMMHRELYERVGGFDEAFRDGAGYEDRDFIWRLSNAGAQFIKRDDLVVTHPKAGASIAWGEAKFTRNRKLFEKKWGAGRLITIACVQAGNYCGRGAEYVNKLHDAVLRRMPGGVKFRFVCLTDDPSGLHPDIEPIALPDDLEGWYGKLYLFKRGLFPAGERVIFFDLDTLIVGKLDDLVSYNGQFATLSDFYFPERVGPAVMAWEVGDYTASIWQEWCAEGQPRNSLGDLWWLNRLDQGRFAHRADRLQKLFPGMFCSYKRDCAGKPPRDAKVICFHGHPRPHEADDEWVAMAWAIGGASLADLEVVSNTKFEQVARNVQHSCKLDLPWLPLVSTPLVQPVAIVGGGPSLVGKLDELFERQQRGDALIFATNGSYNFLRERGIEADAQVIIDARPENAAFIKHRAKRFFLASQCAAETFERAMPEPITLVHMNTRGILDSIPLNIKPVNLISSGSTVGLAAMAIAYCLGHRQMYLYGMDSSIDEKKHHAYAQPANDQDRIVEAIVGGRKFKAAPWMIAQAEHFQKLAAELAQDGCKIHVRCGGLLGHVAWLMAQQREAHAAA